MQLNSFIWDNYKQTEGGKIAIQDFAERKPENLLVKYGGYSETEKQALKEETTDLLLFTSKPQLPKNLTPSGAEALFDEIIREGITLTFENGESETFHPSNDDFLGIISIISTWLYYSYPYYFKPYYFTHKFSLLTRIADSFALDLPIVPLKRYKDQRLKYYFQLCSSFLEFQKANNLSAEEFCAFLYDFAPSFLEKSEKSSDVLPQPTQVWMIGGNKAGGDFDFVDNAETDDISFWQGNEDTKRGDILVMYCLSPRSYVHSVWRAIADGIADPFFYWYGSIYIGQGQKIDPPITINELKADPHFRQNPLVRKNLQGINGYPLNSEDYHCLQQMIVAKGGKIDHLPKLYRHTFELNKNLINEREVELNLIEPLLQKLGYGQSDWVRQLPVRMGRGERNFPDYAFLTDSTKGYEKASMLIESKFWIRNNRELEETFKQVWSYGQRLNASTLVIADKDALWIYKRQQESFDRTKYLKLFWKELEIPDSFNDLKRFISR